MSLVTPDFGLLVWMTLIFAIVLFILAKFGFPAITSMVDKRAAKIEKALKDAEQAEKQLSSLSERQAELLEQTRAEQNRLIQQASRERERIIESAKAQAQAEADKILQNAKNEIRAEKQSALRDLSALVSSLSVQVAEKIVRHKLETDPQEQLKLIDSLIEEASHLNDSSGVQRKA